MDNQLQQQLQLQLQLQLYNMIAALLQQQHQPPNQPAQPSSIINQMPALQFLSNHQTQTLLAPPMAHHANEPANQQHHHQVVVSSGATSVTSTGNHNHTINNNHSHKEPPPPLAAIVANHQLRKQSENLSASSTDGASPEGTANGQKKREGGRVVTFSEDQRSLLEAVFEQNNYLHPQEYEELSQHISVPSRNIKIWFKNRRSKQRLSFAAKSKQ